MSDIKYKIYGCGAVIATSSIGPVLAKEKTLNEILALTDKDISQTLGDLPPERNTASTWPPAPCSPASRSTEKPQRPGQAAISRTQRIAL